jgi:thioester reductase-like protein
MTTFITGANGFLGSYVANILLEETDQRLKVFIRATDEQGAHEKLWKGLQLHMSPGRFWEHMDRVDFVYGDLHAPNLGIDEATYAELTREVDSVLHIAASLNRKSSKACLNTNLRGTLSVIKLAKAIDVKRKRKGGLRRYSHVSTVAVAGMRDSEVVVEDGAIEWDRSDYDPYARTKKFCEHMARELLPNVQKTFFRPSIVMGDSRFPETSQFDMVRAFCTLTDMPIVPFDPSGRLDIVNADWVGRAVAEIHMAAEPRHDIYHLSSGTSSRTIGEVARAVGEVAGKRPRFVAGLAKPFDTLVNTLAGIRSRNPATYIASLLKVFLPYITYDTVFDNRRAVNEIGLAPVPFVQYCGDLYRFSKRVNFEYPHVPLPPRSESKVRAA